MTSAFVSPTDLTLAGGPIRHYLAGDPARPAVLLLHGGMLDTVGFTWRFIAPALAEDFAVHAIDLPRHGGSRPWTGPLTQDRFERILVELLDALGLDRAALVGLSLGAGVSIGFAINHPDRVSGLVLAAPGGVGARRSAQFPTWLALNTPGLLGAASRYLARSPESIRKSLATQLIAAGDQTPAFDELLALAVEEVEAKARHGEPALDDWMVRAYGPWRMRLDFTPYLSRLEVPSLWLRGDQDPLVGDAELAAAVAEAPNARLETLPACGHLATLDQPDRFAALVREHLAGLRP